MNIVVLANGDFAAPAFELLAGSSHRILALFVMPLRGKTRKKAAPSAVRLVAEKFNIPIYEYDDINAAEGVDALRSLEPDIMFICDYGKILSREAIQTARFGGVNLHGSLLPKYRGAAPVHRAILAGETVIGVSVIHITPQVDAGPVIARIEREPTSHDESLTVIELESELSRLGAPLVLDSIEKIEFHTEKSIEQEHDLATKAPKIRKEEGRIDWKKSAKEIVNQYRAFQPWPKTFSDWIRDGKEELRIILGPLREGPFIPPMESKTVPGEVITAKDNVLLVRCGSGTVRVMRVQPAGKREMTAEEFLRGYRMTEGQRLQ